MTSVFIRPASLTDIPSIIIYRNPFGLKALRDLYMAEWRLRGYWGFP